MLLMFIFVSSIFAITYLYWYKDLTTNDKYAIGTTTHFTSGSYGATEVNYYFMTNGEVYKGCQYIRFHRDKVKVPDGKYFVIYSKINPKKSILIFHKKAPEDPTLLNVDSLEFDLENIDFWKL